MENILKLKYGRSLLVDVGLGGVTWLYEFSFSGGGKRFRNKKGILTHY